MPSPDSSVSTCCLPAKLLRPLRVRGSVHPLQPAASSDSEFMYVTKKVRLRVVHILPGQRSRPSSAQPLRGSKRLSLSEEYWFTRWSRPLGSGGCNCSFRRSEKRIVDLESLVERLLQEALFQAYQECVVLRGDEDVKREVRGREVCEHGRQGRHVMKPCVMLLHGIGSTAEAWKTVLDSLVSRGFEVFAPDLLGHGYSSAPDKRKLYTFQNLLSQMVAVFDNYVGKSQSKKCILIGHSFGCSLATALYRSRVHQVVQLVLISGGGPTPLAPPVTDNEISVLGCMQAIIKPLLLCGMKRSIFFASRGKHFSICGESTDVPSHIIQYYHMGQNWPEGDAAFHRKILVPTLLVHGLKDQKITLVQECEMERTIPRAFLELIPLAGHVPLIDTPEHLSHMILCFIDWWSR